MKLKWNKWVEGKGVPEDVPMDEVLLIKHEGKHEGKREYGIGNFFLNSQGEKLGTVGDAFYFDRKIIAWVSIQNLIDWGTTCGE